MKNAAFSSTAGVAGAPPVMPFFREYLREVVRPRVEAALRDLDANLTEHAWRALLGTLGQDGAVDPAALRTLVEQQIGLSLTVHLDAAFTDGTVLGHAGEGAEPAEPIMVRRRPMSLIDNPIARAVLG